MNPRAMTVATLAFFLLTLGAPASSSASTTETVIATGRADGMRAFYGKRFGEAEVAFDRVLDLVPMDALSLAFADAAAAHVPEDFARRQRAAEMLLSAHPEDPQALLRRGYLELFGTIAGHERAVSARDDFEHVLRLMPGCVAAHDGLGVLRYRERSISAAKREFEAALALDPDDVLAHEELGEIEQTDLRDPQRALSHFAVVPDLVPSYADGFFHLGSVLFDLGQSDMAQAYLERALDLDPDGVGQAGQYGYTLLARIALKNGRPEQARVLLKHALAIGADAGYAKTLLADLERRPHELGPHPTASP
ncbi:MAG TPA: tetratricopeptide repeat protein [Candidatus Baltobacteraceae bacterium]|jgi:Tfp pilus assembly protein PilF|nr:tetratricopeptide repeat protein [Candidatus Baltobacteraceae bacterium]